MTSEQFRQLVESTAPFLQLLASLGVLFGIFTALLGFRRYLAERERDRAHQDKSYLAALRKSIFVSRPIFEELNHLLKHELFYEMASTFASSAPISMSINDVTDATKAYVKKYGPRGAPWYLFYEQEESLKQALKEGLADRWLYFRIPDLNDPDYLKTWQTFYTEEGTYRSRTFFPVPIRTKLVELFKEHTSTIGTELEPYRFDYPSLSRVLLSANRFFVSLEESYMRDALDAEVWKKAIVDVAIEAISQQSQAQGEVEETGPEHEQTEAGEQGAAQEQIIAAASQELAQQEPEERRREFVKGKMNTVRGSDQLKERVTKQVVMRWYTETLVQDLEAINAVLELVEIVTRTYLSKSDEELFSIREAEGKLRFAPIEQTPRPEQMLREAFDGLKPVLTDFDRESYHDLAKRIGQISSQRS